MAKSCHKPLDQNLTMRTLPLLRICLLLVCSTCVTQADAPWQWTDIEGAVQAPFANTNTKALVVVFIDVECPVANYFQPTLRRMAAATTERGARFLFVHPDPDRTAAAARKHAKEFKVPGPVVLDPELATAKRLKAEVTPEAFVITPDGTLRYRGRVNDMFIRPGKKRVKPRTHDLQNALDAVLAGKPVTVAETKPIGCYIFYQDEDAAAP